MTTRVTEGARRERPSSFLASGGFAAQRSRARALPLLNQKKKRGCLQSTQKPVTCPPCESPIAQWLEVPGRSWVWFGTKKSEGRREEPLGTMSYQTNSKQSPPFWLLIGQKSTKVFRYQSAARTAVTVGNWPGQYQPSINPTVYNLGRPK